MTLRQFLILMTAGSALAWAALAMIVSGTDPEEVPLAVVIVFGVALFLALTGTFSLIGFGLRTMFGRDEAVLSRRVLAAFRQGAILGGVLTAALFMNARGWFGLFGASVLVSAAVFLELFFMTARISTDNRPGLFIFSGCILVLVNASRKLADVILNGLLRGP